MIRLSTRRVAVGLVGLLATLFSLHLSLQLLVTFGLLDPNWWGLRTLLQLIHVDQEQNLTTFLATMMLVACGLLALWLRQIESLPRPGWGLLVIVFLAAGFDEYVAVHERFNVVVGDLLNTSGWLMFAWVVPGTLAAILVAVAFLRPLRALPPGTQRGLVLGAGLFLFGALVVEVVGSKMWADLGPNSVPYLLSSTTEEAFEFAGVLVWMHTLCHHLRSLTDVPTLQLAVAPPVDTRPDRRDPATDLLAR